jgi:glycerol-1-phosphate dehydrogenase [NAD(P)+]
MPLNKSFHRMQLPREVIVGRETLNLLGRVCKKLGFSQSALVVTGPKTQEVAGKKAIDFLEDAGIQVNYFIASNSTMENVNVVEEKIRELKPQVVLGVGGGTKIDVAKLGSAHQGVPFISVPTTASHDGIASPFASLKGLDKPYSRTAQTPMAILADTDVILQAPYRSVASGCGDVIAKLIAVRDWRIAHLVTNEYYGEYAASLALMSATLVMKNVGVIKPGEEEGVRVLLEALISCSVAMSIAGSSRPCSGSEHLFSHALDLVAPKPAMHGEQCGVGTIIMAYLHKRDWKPVRATLQKVGAPTTAGELGIEPEYIIEALVKARTIRPERYTILDEKRLNYESAKKIAKLTGVLD